MTKEQYIHTVNPCFGCDCYDPDREGCTMPSIDRDYACRLNDEEFKIKNYYYNNEDFKTYVDKCRSDRKISLDDMLSHKLIKEVYLYYKEVNNGTKK